ncbi:ABC transporter permease [Sphingomonas sp. ac-8]|uniref:ABC transporter permease n=1 Tax=Sphingomonas sp. ac-8 TaxID=3242977 RepID=UPI003A805CC7
MSNFRRMLRQTLTIARRDFIATVLTPTFLIFLLAPMLFASFGALGSLGARAVGEGGGARERLYAIAEPAAAARFRAADDSARDFLSPQAMPPALEVVQPEGDPAAQARRLLAQQERDVPAVLYGSPERPSILHASSVSRSSNYLAMLAEQVARDGRAGITAPLSQPRFEQVTRASGTIGGKNAAAGFAVIALFAVTLILASQAVGTMAEERSNKVIEVLAAAVPLEAVFLGKLIGMFGVAILFVLFWGTVIGNVGAVLPGGAGPLSGIAPAVGLPAFALLFAVYFAAAFLLLGAVFLGIGAQASTPREIQMLSLPLTLFQMGMFALSLTAAGKPGSWIATFAQVFPFSSPFAMAARAANRPELWPHLLAIGWQALWVALTITIGARLFRRGVLQSAGPKFRWASLVGR